MRVLVAVDEPALGIRLAHLLENHGHRVTRLRGLGPPKTEHIDAAIVAPASFDAKGLALARKLAADGRRVIVLTDSAEAVRSLSRTLPEAAPIQSTDEQ